MELYLGDGGALARYGFESEYEGTMHLYVSLSDDGLHADNSRSAKIVVNQISHNYDHISMSTLSDDSYWDWYYIDEVFITYDNLVTFEKVRTTQAAFVMDKFKLSKNKMKLESEDVPISQPGYIPSNDGTGSGSSGTSDGSQTTSSTVLAEDCYSEYEELISETREHNAAQVPGSGGVWIKYIGIIESCYELAFECYDEADQIENECWNPHSVDGTDNQICIKEKQERHLACAEEEISCHEEIWKEECGLE